MSNPKIMLSNVTWGQYLAGATVLLIIYYTIVIMIFYRQEVSDLIRKRQLLPRQGEDKKGGMERPDFDGLEAVVADIKGILEKAGKEASKSELLGRLTDRLASYTGLRHPAFRIAIIHFILKNAENICGVGFSEEELEDVLKNLPR